jgi:hypothetical protein
MEPAGVMLFERYEVQLDLNDQQRQEYENDPFTFTKRFLEEQGFEVREIQLIRGEDSAETDGAEFQTAYHIQYPEGERSGWMCCCA